ncbi:MAG: class I SAM-dependent methyltransferase [Candidatus Zixiibacteriota bacterium]|nr:MAG: class I SAM-dependent methyltransferase [candidate division Zixibacteria bacterium]
MSRIKGRFAKSYDRFIKRKSLLPDGILKLVKTYQPEKIADFGCGTGSVAIGLALEGYNVTGVDISKDMLKIARQKARNLRIDAQFKQANIVDIDLKCKFDLILSLGNTIPLIYRIKDARKVFRNFARHLNPGGILVIQQLNYDRILREKPHTFAVDRIENQLRIKQYKYVKNMINFTVTIVDHSYVPPKLERTRSKLRPWKKNDLLSELRDAGFYKLSAFGDYKESRFITESNDLIVVGKLRSGK